MSSNKQSVKLYTTDQVVDIFEKYGNMSAINARNILDLSESIEVPTDEELEKEVSDYSLIQYKNGFRRGAKWMLDKIQGGNNEE